MLGNDAVAELLIEAQVAGELPADAHPHLRVSGGMGIVVDPGHQSLANALSLMGRINGDAAHVQVAGFRLEAKAADSLAVQHCQGSAAILEVVADGFLRFTDGSARWVQLVVFPECELGQTVHGGGRFRPAAPDLDTYQFDSRSIRPRRRAERSAQLKTTWAIRSVATVVKASRNMTSPSERLGNIRIACPPNRLRRMISIQ